MVCDSRKIPQLIVRVISLSDTPLKSTPLLDLLPSSPSPLAWFGKHTSMVAWGQAARWTGAGAHTFEEAAAWWNAVSASAIIDGPARAPHLPLALGSFGFAAPTPSLLTVPRVLVLDTPQERWAAIFGEGVAADPLDVLAQAPHEATRPPEGLRPIVSDEDAARWVASVGSVIERLRTGDAQKAVMARDMLVRADTPIDPRYLLARLNELYPKTWRFAIDGLIGASPEMLARARNGELYSRVLAGTAPAGRGHELMDSKKNLREHALALESVTSVLAPLVPQLDASDSPFILDLPNVAHLASDVTAPMGELSLLEVVHALHPTAAVCGTPREAALALITECEGLERGRYCGPIGWVDAAGEGEFCIALRCGLVEDEGLSLRVFAGGGIMPDSDPEEELAETREKMAPLLDALGLEVS